MLVQYVKDGSLLSIDDALAREMLKAGTVRRARRTAPPAIGGPALGEDVDPNFAVVVVETPDAPGGS